MTTNAPDTDPRTDPEPQAVTESASGMRGVIKDQAARIADLEGQLGESEGENRVITMGQAYKAIELDPESGIGKAVATIFDGEAEQLAEFAETEFGYVHVAEHPYARTIADGQKRLDELGNSAGSVGVPTQADDLAKAEAQGDYAKTMAIKSRQVENMFRR